MLAKRQSSVLPYWILFDVSGVIKIMNANSNPNSGCLCVPSAASSPPTLGSCSSAAAAGWNVTIGSEVSGALKQAPQTGDGPNIAAIAGGAAAGVAVLVGIAGLIYYLSKRNKKGQPSSGNPDQHPDTTNELLPEKSEKLGQFATPVNAISLGEGSSLYFAHGGDLSKGIGSVEVKKFATAAVKHVPGSDDELALAPGGSSDRTRGVDDSADTFHLQTNYISRSRSATVGHTEQGRWTAKTGSFLFVVSLRPRKIRRELPRIRIG